MTTREKQLVARLRKKMGDNPTTLVASGDIGSTVYLWDESTELFVATVALAEHVGLTCAETSEWVWTDDEHYDELVSARVVLFKGKLTSLENITEIEEEIIILKAKANFLRNLMLDSARYAKYNLRDTSAEKTSPQEYLDMARAIENYIKQLLDEGAGDESEDIGAKITQGFITRYSREHDMILPAKYDSDPPLLPFSLSQDSKGIYITIRRIFYTDFNAIFIKKGVSPDTGTTIKTLQVLKDWTILDEDVESGVTYLYTVVNEDINGNQTEKTEEITFA